MSLIEKGMFTEIVICCMLYNKFDFHNVTLQIHFTKSVTARVYIFEMVFCVCFGENLELSEL